MGKKHVWIIAVLIAAVLSVVTFCHSERTRRAEESLRRDPSALVGMTNSSQLIAPNGVIHLEVVTTPADQQRGLSGRASLPKDMGMLFVFPTAEQQSFWMKDMQFPLDILWIANGVVVDLVTLSAPVVGEDIPQYQTHVPAEWVLELNAGEAKELGLGIGAKVRIER